MKYELFEHTADMGLRIYGGSLRELFENAGVALFEQITDLSLVNAVDALDVSASGETAEDLLVAWLRELLYLFHGERYLLKEFRIKEMGEGLLKAVVKGERMDTGRHMMGHEVKAATYHNLEVKEAGGVWQATVVFDV